MGRVTVSSVRGTGYRVPHRTSGRSNLALFLGWSPVPAIVSGSCFLGLAMGKTKP